MEITEKERKEKKKVEDDHKHKKQLRDAIREFGDDAVIVYCDGSCHNATGNRGGYGIFMQWRNQTNEIAGGAFSNTTSSRMEILAVATALENLKSNFKVILISDSQYVVNTLTMGWVQSWEKINYAGKANSDLWKKVMKAYRKFPRENVKFLWVKGHNGNEGNEKADRLAGEGALNEPVTVDRKNFL